MSRSGFAVVVVGSAAGLGLALLVAEVVDRSPATHVAAVRSAGSGANGDALRVLHAWDARRAAAYATGSQERLRDLYVPGSAAGANDVQLMERYRSRGLRVVDMRTQVLALAVVRRRADHWDLRVTDRLARADAVRKGTRLPLPRDTTSTRVVTLRRGEDGRWRVSDVEDVPPAR